MQRSLTLIGLVVVICFSGWTRPLAAVEKKTQKSDAKKIVRFTLTGEYPDETSFNLMSALKDSDDEKNLLAIIERFDAAAKDKQVAAVWLRMDDFKPEGGNIEDFRAAIGRIRKEGKPVYAELYTDADAAVYRVALACNKIYLADGSSLEILGPAMQSMHFKGLMDKIGLQFDVLRMGSCKGAYEPFTHDKMSKEVHENYQSLVDDRYQSLVETIAAGRKLSDTKVRRRIDQGIFSAAAAKKARLVDEVVDTARTEIELRKAAGVASDAKIDVHYRKKKKEEINGIMDVLKLLSGSHEKKSSGKAKIAVVYETGEIVTGPSSAGGMLSGKSQGSTTIVKMLRKVGDDPSVKAVVVRIDGPGGSATASDLIWQETMRLRAKKPVISSMGSVAASGTYFTAVAGTRIIAEPGTLTGSIGVLGGKLVKKALLEKLGVTSEFIGRGAMSGIVRDRPFTPEERKVLTRYIEQTYLDFKSKVARCRGMTVQQVGKLAEGRVYTARQAKKLGLVDELGTLSDAIAAARKAAGLKPGDPAEIVEYPEAKTIFDLFGGNRDDDEASLALAVQALGVPAKTVRQLNLPSFLFRSASSGRPQLYFWTAVPPIR